MSYIIENRKISVRVVKLFINIKHKYDKIIVGILSQHSEYHVFFYKINIYRKNFDNMRVIFRILI